MSYEIISTPSYQFIVPSQILLKQLVHSKNLFKDLTIIYKRKAKKDIAYILQILLQDLLVNFSLKGLFASDYNHTQLTGTDKSLLLKKVSQFIQAIIDVLKHQLKDFLPKIAQEIIVDSLKICGGILISLFALIFGLTHVQAVQYLFP